MFGALPSRIARRSTGSARPSISRNTIPATSWGALAPWRRAIRRITRSEYSSSSFVPAMTCRTMDVAAITSAASRASPNEPTRMASGRASAASSSASASTKSTARKPTTSVPGSRSAAITGGRTALTTAITAATRKAAPVSSSDTPRISPAATQTDTAEMSHATSRRSGRKRGVIGAQRGVSPYACGRSTHLSSGRCSPGAAIATRVPASPRIDVRASLPTSGRGGSLVLFRPKENPDERCRSRDLRGNPAVAGGRDQRHLRLRRPGRRQHLQGRHQVRPRRPQHPGLGADPPGRAPARGGVLADVRQHVRTHMGDRRRQPRRHRRTAVHRRCLSVVVALPYSPCASTSSTGSSCTARTRKWRGARV